MPIAEWILADEVIFIRRPEDILAIRVVHSPNITHPDTAILQFRDEKLYFDGEYIPTESFMAFVGIFDLFEDAADWTIIHHPADER